MTPRSPADRRLAALSHLGIPIYGPFLPLALHQANRDHLFRRRHASASFSLTIVWMVIYIPIVVGSVLNWWPPHVMMVAIGAGMVLEAPNVVRALRGAEPIRLVPMTILPID